MRISCKLYSGNFFKPAQWSATKLDNIDSYLYYKLGIDFFLDYFFKLW
jgi:hypothetical protein